MNAARTVVSVLLVAGAMLPARTPPAADCLRQVGELPEGPALAVDMHGLSVARTARLLGVAEGTVKSRCARGRRRLAVVLGPGRAELG